MLFLGVLTGAIGLKYSVALYLKLNPDIEELLPRTSRSVLDLFEVRNRLLSTQNIGILIFSDHPKESRAFVDALVADLQKQPPELVAGVEYRIHQELAFFNTRKPLYMDLPDLQKVRDYVRERIAYEKALYNPINIFSGVEIREPRLDVGGLEQKYLGKVSSYLHLPQGYYATEDGKIRAVLVNQPGTLGGVDGAHRFREVINESIARVHPEQYSEDIQLHFTGGVQDLIEEHASLMADLELSSIIVMVLVTLGLVFFFRAIFASFILVTSLLVGCFWAFGISYYFIGSLNANSAFLGAIIIGNGINFGLILLARYLEELRAKRRHLRSLYTGMTRTAGATVVAALAAGLSYGSLAFTNFRGFQQFGIIGLIGMVMCWLSAYTFLPALLHGIHLAFGYGDRIRRKAKPRQLLSFWLAQRIRRNSKGIVLLSVVSSFAALGAVLFYQGEILETNLDNLRDRTSAESGSSFYSKYLHQIFHGYPHPMAILARNAEDADQIAERLRNRRKRDGEKSLVASVVSVDDFIPSHQKEKIALLGEIERLLPSNWVEEMSKPDRERLQQFLHPNSLKPVTPDLLPPLVKSKLTEKSGVFGNLVLAEPPVTGVTSDALKLVDFVQELREETDAVSPGTPVAGQLAVSADMVSAIKRDGPLATALALGAVVILVVLLFRRVNTIAMVMFSLGIGILWLVGLIFATDLKINFLNFIALPITFGIGVDYAVNIFQRYRLERRKSIVRVIMNTGGAVILVSYTTIVGYGSLLIAGNRAFVSFGWLAVLGELTCLAAAVVALPATLEWLRQRRVAMEMGRDENTQEWNTALLKQGIATPKSSIPGERPVERPKF